MLRYVVAGLQRKRGDFHIGLFTVFLVVASITMLKSVIDATPVLFLQMAETSNGAIDFTLSGANPLTACKRQGNINYYAMDPFGNQS